MRDTWAGAELIAEGPQWGELPAAAADAACSTPVLCLPQAGDESPLGAMVDAPGCDVAVVVQTDACSGASYEVGAPVDDAISCDEQASGEPVVCYERERVLTAIPYAERALGAGRLRPLWVVLDGQPVIPTGYFHDQELDVSCMAIDLGGELRCDPWDPVRDLHVANPNDASGWKQVFAEDTCETSLGFAYLPECGEAAPPLARSIGPGATNLVRMRSIGAPAVAGTYTGFSPSPGFVLDCMPSPEPPEELFEAEPVELGELARIEEVVR